MERAYDVVVFGATGFTGRLVAQELARVAPPGLRLAIAGRSQEKLEALARSLGREVGVVIADSAAPDALARCTKVVCTTVGPYLHQGLPLVKACAAAGTHLADLCGEVLFMRDSIDAADPLARQTGARIVHGCGFDSIPSDLGVLLLHQALVDRGEAGRLGQVTLYVEKLKGGFSGGTLASLEHSLREGRADRARLKQLVDVHALSPDRAREGKDDRDLASVRHEPAIGQWTAPFVMASVNTRVVRRSNALLGHAYGPAFRYREVSATGPGPRGFLRAASVTATLAAAFTGLAFAPTRALLHLALPRPGEGPDEAARTKGSFRFRFEAQVEGGAPISARVTGKGDPGYGATSRMLAQACLALASDPPVGPAGVLTPATALGLPFLSRLRPHGFTFDVV